MVNSPFSYLLIYLDSDFAIFYSYLLEDTVGLMEKAMAPHSSTLDWKVPWTEEPGGLQSMGSIRVGYN